jgi:hypothetical protein
MTKEPDLFGLKKNSNLDVCMRTTADNINNSTSTNFIEECDSIMLPRTSTFSMH